MPKRIRLTRRFPAAMTEEAYRRLKRFANDNDMDEGEALSFLFENLDSLLSKDTFSQRLKLFRTELEDKNR